MASENNNKITTRSDLNFNYNRQLRELRINCNHKSGKGPTLKPATESNDANHKNLGDSYAVCTNCGEVVPTISVTKEDFRQAYDTINAMCNQLKVLGNPSEKDMEQIKNVQAMTDDLKTVFAPFYFDEMKKLNNGNNNKARNNEHSRGRIGINSSQFNTR